MKGIVRLGDPTTHGGQVIQASSKMMVHGRPAALVGDLISCPHPGHGTNPIIEGSSTMFFEGRAVAIDGCACACGCTLISTMPSVGGK
ncbi:MULTISPECIES: PAAR domain-containing protein [unclassified Neisseria]|nr:MULTISPECIES: PAAR domain-containing protein [unclassified Neisseria]MDO1509198.1 PAAR domain-containing protein [Neisseria sp. MVDL19-042950]MDO1515523.1 PAAR domain-containing protein [Neisseria sp. MVDL18-041461]MDO1562882.1 PAAR domain-containing protein [Neisseria sp. MVDL20-010259]